MLLYYITDRKSLAGTDAQQRSRLLVKIAEAAHAGVDYIQLREKDLPPRDLELLARDAVRTVRENSATTKLLINGRADVALASGADGVHLPAGKLAVCDVRAQWMQTSERAPLIAVSAHTLAEVRAAAADGADFAVLAPIFEKANTDVQGIGIDALRAACASTPRISDRTLCDISARRSHSGQRRRLSGCRRRRSRGDSLVSERRHRRNGSTPARVGTHLAAYSRSRLPGQRLQHHIDQRQHDGSPKGRPEAADHEIGRQQGRGKHQHQRIDDPPEDSQGHKSQRQA